MPGIYIHIPFCKKACHYCNFHFSTNLSYKDLLVASLIKEIEMQRDFFNKIPDANNKIESIYFGGGTPSLLSEGELLGLLERIFNHFDVSEKAEITLEANPDDLSKANLRLFQGAGINRLSIGVQSFLEADLKWMNRSHTAAQSRRCVKDAQDVGYENITLDLIFGSPASPADAWIYNLEQFITLKVPHISCYGITVEPRTPLAVMIEKNKIIPPREEVYATHFTQTMDFLESMGFEHYEISNYCKDQKYAIHNSGYWKGIPYLGLGPAAHSFNGRMRQWNVAHNHNYIKQVSSNALNPTIEKLNKKDIFNESIMTGLRTKWGWDIASNAQTYPNFYQQISQTINQKIQAGKLQQNDKKLILTRSGKLTADTEISDLFII